MAAALSIGVRAASDLALSFYFSFFGCWRSKLQSLWISFPSMISSDVHYMCVSAAIFFYFSFFFFCHHRHCRWLEGEVKLALLSTVFIGNCACDRSLRWQCHPELVAWAVKHIAGGGRININNMFMFIFFYFMLLATAKADGR